ncbi:hypothetical protein D3C84_675270 [compost metagenome]
MRDHTIGRVYPRVSGTLDQGGGWEIHGGELAGNGEYVAASIDAVGALDTQVVSIEGATGDLLRQVRVADIFLLLAGFRVGLGVGGIEAAQERSYVPLQRAGIVSGWTDADIAGHVDCPGAAGVGELFRSDVEHFDTIGVSDRVDAGYGNIHANADTGEALLVAISDLTVESGFDGRAIGQVDATGGVGNGAVRSEPEGFIGIVGREDDRLGVIKLPRRRVEDAHVCRSPGGWCRAGADRLAQTQV